MEAERRRARFRKPLSDCSNTNANATTPSSHSSSPSSLRLKPQKRLLSSSIKKHLTNSDGKSANSTDTSQNVSLLPPSVASPLLRPPMLSSASGRGNSEALEPCSVNSCRQTVEKRKRKIPPTEVEDVIIAEKRRNRGKENVDPNTCTPATKKIGVTQSTLQKEKISKSENLLPPPNASEALEPCSVNSHRQIADKRKSKIPSTEELYEDVVIEEKTRSKGKEKVDPKLCTPATKKIDITESTAQKENTLESVYLLPPPIESTPSQPRSLSVSGRDGSEPFEPCYSRRRTAEKRKGTTEASDELLKDMLIARKRTSKGKAIAEPLSCPPATKKQKTGENIKETGGDSPSKANTVPTKKGAKHALSQEFIEQQRAYFAEIDAYELPEEEVDSISEED